MAKMPPVANLEKRIKRHVVGKEKSFFVSTLPGLEHLCRQELASLLALGVTPTVKGGVAFQGRIQACYLANLNLRMANRILMRIESFEATNFRQLEKKLKHVPWELYLPWGGDCDIKVSARHSRLYHTEAILERVQGVLAERWDADTSKLGGHGPEMPFPQTLFLRALDDRFTLSIDSSGDLLHKRGMKIQVGKAPIRESIAAAILNLAGYTDGGILLDPMCGSGTFSLEGAMMANRIPAGWHRAFAFMGWPCFKPARWKHIRREAEKSIIERTEPVVFASDKDPRICENLKQVVHDNGFSNTVSVIKKDFFDLQPSCQYGPSEKEQERLVVINPPYGRRLESKILAEKLFLEICRKVKADFKGWKIALVVPAKNLVRKVPFAVVSHGFFHGGLHLTLVTGRVSP